MTTQRKAGRPAGRSNVRPSKTAVESYYRLLTNAAEAGSVQAAAALIDIHERHHKPKEAAR
jgi:hypothetical protein